MGLISAAHGALVRVNTLLLSFGRTIGWLLMVAMVAVILAQVFYRYVLSDALSWAEEGALALMIWMIGTTAPSAYRWGGFVAIDLLSELLPKWPRFILTVALLLIANVVTAMLLYHAWIHYSSPILFNSSGLNRMLQDSGINQALGTNFEFRAAYIYFGMVVCFALLYLVNIELILRKVGQTFAGEERFPDPHPPAYMAGTEVGAE